MNEAKALLRLQELDTEYTQLKHSAENLPQKAKIAAARAAAKKVNSELTRILGQRKDLEIEINELEVHKKFLTDKVTEVQNADATNYRQSQDLEYSLSSLAKKLEKIEFQNNQLMEQFETAEKSEAKAHALSEKLKTEEQDLTLAYKLALEKIAKQVKAISLERADVAARLPEQTLANYEACRKRFGGIAVETLVGNRPSACRVALQTSQYSDIRRAKKDVTVCPYCRRILVIQEAE